MGGARLTFGLVLLGALVACAPATLAPASQGSQSAAPPAAGAKVLTLAILREPETLVSPTGGASRTGGAHNPRYIAHNRLVAPDAHGVYQPQIAAEKPAIDSGTWRVNPDGTMETTWKLRHNVKWHDGTPFTSDDLLFTFAIRKDPELCCAAGRPALMRSAVAPDPFTVVIHWSDTYVDADRAQELEPLPRHLLEPAYRRGPESVLNSPRLTTEFVGLGPYRLVKWEPGSHMEFTRFEDYFLGRPPLDVVVVRFLDDPNTLIAGVLSGAVDAILPPGIDVGAAVELRRQWEGTGNEVRFNVGDNFQNVQVQFRPEYARPTNGLTVRAVRQAFYHAIDRQTLAEVASQSVTPIADSWISPLDALRAQVETAVPQFPFDRDRAWQLLAEAGWGRGPDGLLVHSVTGEHFEVELRANQGGGSERELNVIAENWKAMGAQVTLNLVPVARQQDNEYRATFPGGYLFFSGAAAYLSSRLHSSQIAIPERRWQGRNRGGYSNSQVDSLLDRLVATIDPDQRLVLHRELLREQMGDVPVMPLYWFVDPLPLRAGVRVGAVPKGEVTANFFEWNTG